MTTRRLTVVTAGLRRPSSTRLLADRLAAATLQALGGAGIDTGHDVVELRDHAKEIADNLLTGFAGGGLRSAVDRLAKADGLIAATGGTARHSLVLDHALRPLFTYLGAVVVPTAVYAAAEDWGSVDHHDGGLTQRIDRAAAELATLVAARERVTKTDPYQNPPPFETLLAAGERTHAA